MGENPNNPNTVSAALAVVRVKKNLKYLMNVYYKYVVKCARFGLARQDINLYNG